MRSKKAILEAVGDMFFARNQAAFIAKARGGADEFGNTWEPLKDSTRAKKERARSKSISANKGKKYEHQEEKLYRQLLKAGMSPDSALTKAFFIKMTAEGNVPINQDTMRLTNSFRQRWANSDQVREIHGSTGVFGTRTPYAKYVHAKRRIIPIRSQAMQWVREAVSLYAARKAKEAIDAGAARESTASRAV